MPIPMKKEELYTFADLLTWEERAELIDGEVFLMAPPSRVHQKILTELLRQLANFLDGRSCEVYPAPFAVRLFEGESDRPKDVATVVEPDISVVCDLRKIDHRGCKGAPDMVIEILSPSTRSHDRLTKFALYQQAGVREYWIVDPETASAQVFLLDETGRFCAGIRYGRETTIPVTVLDGCSIDFCKIFPKQA